MSAKEIEMSKELGIQTLTQEEWIKERQAGIGASEVATALGLNPYKSPYTLWAEKRGIVLPNARETLAMRLGHLLEPIVTTLYEDETGRRTHDPGEFAFRRSTDWDFLFCTPDRIVYDGKRGFGALELKTSGQFSAKDWRGGSVPLHHQVQNQAQMLILNLKWGSVAGLIGNRDFFTRDFDRQDGLLFKVVEHLKRFWDRVQTGTAPPVDGSKSTKETLCLLHPNDNGATATLSSDTVNQDKRLIEIKAMLKKLETEKIELENWFKEQIGDATFGEFGNVRYSLKTQVRKGKITVADEYLDRLVTTDIPFEQKDSQFRVLRKLKVGK